MSQTPVIEIERLRKFYRGKHRGIDGLDLKVYQGEVFGFLLSLALLMREASRR